MFHEKIAIALEGRQGLADVPEIEAPRRVIEYFNRGAQKGFDEAGYFMYQGVKVYEAGKVEETKLREPHPTDNMHWPRPK